MPLVAVCLGEPADRGAEAVVPRAAGKRDGSETTASERFALGLDPPPV
jgi:hypothetical protein